jgi:multidrug transporter EmrE-like cation transporter
MSGPFWLGLFWAMQVAAAVLFKYGTTSPDRYWLGFLAGNLFGASSIFVLMKLYSMWQVNVAGALAGGGAFLLAQFAMIPLFGERLEWRQYIGIVAVALGMALVTYGKVSSCANAGPNVIQASAESP